VSELPRGWRTSTSGDLFEFVTSGSRGWAQFYATDGPLFVRIGNLDHDTILLDLREVQRVNVPLNTEGARTQVRPGDILVSITAELGMVGLVPDDLGEAYVNQHIALARPRPGAEARYIAWFFASEGKRQLLDMRRGATKAGLGLDDIRNVTVVIPPLPEQRRIVAKLEALQERSRRARDALDAIPPLLEKLRQSILAAAFRGDLTKEWRAQQPDVEPADKLLARIRIERRKKWEETELAKLVAKGKPPKDDAWKKKYVEPKPVDAEGLPRLPKGWCWASVESLCDAQRGITYGIVLTGDPVQGGVPTVRCGDIKSFRINVDALKRVAPSIAAEYSRTSLNGGEVLIAIRGTVGATAAAGPEMTGMNISREVAMIPLLMQGLSRFLMYCLAGPETETRLMSHVKGVAQSGINLADLRTLPVPVPPADEQRAVTSLVERLLDVIGSASADRTVLTGRLANLDGAILAKAFRGELVPQDPKDEPVAALPTPAAEAEPTKPPRAGRAAPKRTARSRRG
jgi:type I restriction enzyme S subunit